MSVRPKTPAPMWGSVIDETAQKKIQAAIELGRQEGRMLVGKTLQEGPGHFVTPTVFTDIAADSQLALEEIFGPVVCVFRTDTFGKALELANGTSYALTGGVFSRSPANIERACSQFEVGSLYINRAITGALMKRHPFGGYKMSGTGAKAMGPDYLSQFMNSRTIVENTFRSGFAPLENG